MQTSSKPADIVAGYTATYLLMAWVQVVAQFDLGFFGYVLYPAFFILLVPAPILNVLNLADHEWLLGAWPSTGGFFVLIMAYSTLAYFVTKGISALLKGHDSIHA
jgi:hypothetical protein